MVYSFDFLLRKPVLEIGQLTAKPTKVGKDTGKKKQKLKTVSSNTF